MKVLNRSTFIVSLIGLLVLFAAVNLYAATIGTEKASSKKAWIGIYMQDLNEDIAEAFGLEFDEGVLINGVVDDSPAEKYGLEEGDVIVSFDGRVVDDSGDLTRALKQKQPGDEIKIKILRDNNEKDVALTLGESVELKDKTFTLKKSPKVFYNWKSKMPSSTTFLGVGLQSLNKQLAEYFDVEEGVLISKVMEESPAEKAGLKAGDVILEIDDKEVSSPGDVTKIVKKHEKGDKLNIEVSRRGQNMALAIELEEREVDEEWFGWHSGVNQYQVAPNIPVVKLLLKDLDLEALNDLDLDELNEELEEDMEELREELEQLREELNDLKKEIR